MRCLRIRIAIFVGNHSVGANRDFGHVFGHQVTQLSRVIPSIGFILLNGVNDLFSIPVSYVSIQSKYPNDADPCTQVDQAFHRIEFREFFVNEEEYD